MKTGTALDFAISVRCSLYVSVVGTSFCYCMQITLLMNIIHLVQFVCGIGGSSYILWPPLIVCTCGIVGPL